MGNAGGSKHSRRYFSYFYKYLLSYVLFLILVLSILGAAVQRNFKLTMQREVRRSNRTSVVQIRDLMDTRLQEMERIALNISYNDNLRYYKISGDNYESKQAVKELKKYKSSSGFIYDIAMYYNYGNSGSAPGSRIYTSMTSAAPETFFNTLYHYEDRGVDDFLDMVKSLDTPKMYSARPVWINRSYKNELAAYVYPLTVNTVRPYLDVVFFIQKDTLSDMLKNALGEYSGYVYVLDRQGNPIFYHTGEQPALDRKIIMEQMQDILAIQNMDDMDLDGSRYSAAGITSEYNGWSYVVLRKTDQLIHDVNASKKVFQYVTAFVLLSGLIIAYFLANGQYKPVRKLMDVIPNRENKYAKQSYSNEFEYMTKTIMGVSTENRNLSTQLRSKTALIRDQFIMKLLNGKRTDSREQDSMQEMYGVSFDYPYFLVLEFLPDENRQMSNDKAEEENHREIRDLANFNLKNVAEELSEEIGRGYGIETVDGRGVILLLNLKNGYARDRYISDLAFRVRDFFLKYFGYTLTVGVGNIYDSMDRIHESCLEANRAVYYRLIKGYGNVIFYENIREKQKEKYQYPAMLEQKLVIAIKGGKSGEAETILLEIREHILNHSSSIEAVQCICFGIINTIMKVVDDLNLDAVLFSAKEEENIFYRPFDTVDGLMDRMIGFCSTICSYIQQQKESKNFELQKQIMDMVTREYRDSALSLDTIACRFHMSPSYISRYFKDQTGYSLMHYVDRLRMTEVKRLLKETNDPLADIIRQVGYVDKSSFYRKFKKKEGVTPAQYRSIIQKGQTGVNII